MMKHYEENAKELIEFLLTNNTFPMLREYTDLSQKRSFGRVMIEDLGDSLPFMFWLGEKERKYAEIADATAKVLIKKFQDPNGFFRMQEKKTAVFTMYNFDKMTDLSLGINLMYTLTEDVYYRDTSVKFFDRLGKFIKKSKGFIPLLYSPTIHAGVNFSTGKFGLYIEELCNVYYLTQKEEYLQMARDIATPWIGNAFFKKYGIFPFLVKPPYLKMFANPIFKGYTGFTIDSAMTSKANTNLVYGLNALYKATKEEQLNTALKNWARGICERFLNEDGSLFNVWDSSGHYKFLGCDHAVIDSFLELYRTTKKKDLLKIAEKIANFWLQQQDPSGLIPQGVRGYPVCVDPKLKYTDPAFFRLDPQVDFFVVLIKLYQLTEKQMYRAKAIQLLNALCKYHGEGQAFVDILNPEKKRMSNIIETKFLFLILKALLSERYIKKNIYNDQKVYQLLRDR